MSVCRFKADRSSECIDGAARVWAEATAARDGDTTPGPLDLARRRIRGVLSRSPESVLLTAWNVERVPIAFAAVAPTKKHESELHYLGVDPTAWNQGIGSRLLIELIHVLRLTDTTRVELWVYADNPFAVALYEKLGWRADHQQRTHPTSGRTERHYALALT